MEIKINGKKYLVEFSARGTGYVCVGSICRDLKPTSCEVDYRKEQSRVLKEIRDQIKLQKR